MKIINYSYGYHFSCSIHGKIVMTASEWKNAQRYLFNPSALKKIARFQGGYDVGVAMRLRQDIARTIKRPRGRMWLNIRVPATEALVARFKPTGNFKRANYAIEIPA
jgi:hypothetical protein